MTADNPFRVSKPAAKTVVKSVETNSKAAAMKSEPVDITIYEATPEPTSNTPSFAGRLNLNEFAFQQPANPFRRHRPLLKIEDLNSDVVKREQTSPKRGKRSSRSRSLVLTPTPEPDDARITIKKEFRVKTEAQVTTAPTSDESATPPKIEKLELNSPLITPAEFTAWDLPTIKVPKSAPGQVTESVVPEESSSDAESLQFSTSPTSAPAPQPAALGLFAPPPARSAAMPSSNARSPFFASERDNRPTSSATKRKSSGTAAAARPKKKRAPTSYQGPEVYAHLKPLPDLMAPDMIGIFVGTNPGLKSSAMQHTYASHTNRFWKLLHTSGITERRVPPQEDATLPTKYQFGNTNICDRPTRNQGELSKDEMIASVQTLIDKVRKWKPESVVIVGKKIWEVIWQVRHGRGIKKHEFRYGWQDDSERMGTPKSWEPEELTANGKPWKGAMVFVAATTSGSAAIPKPPEKERIWNELGLWVNGRRKERGLPHYPPGPTYIKEKAGEAANNERIEKEEEEDSDSY